MFKDPEKLKLNPEVVTSSERLVEDDNTAEGDNENSKANTASKRCNASTPNAEATKQQLPLNQGSHHIHQEQKSVSTSDTPELSYLLSSRFSHHAIFLHLDCLPS